MQKWKCFYMGNAILRKSGESFQPFRSDSVNKVDDTIDIENNLHSPDRSCNSGSASGICVVDAATKRKRKLEEKEQVKTRKCQQLQIAKSKSLISVCNLEGVSMDKEFWQKHAIAAEQFKPLEIWEQLVHAFELMKTMSQTVVSGMTGFHNQTLLKYSKIYKQIESEVDAARFSNEERQQKVLETFQFHVQLEFKPGRVTGGLNPSTLLEARRLNDECVDSGDGGSISTKRLVESNCIVQAVLNHKQQNNINTLVRPATYSDRTLHRVIKIVCPKKKPLTATANGHEEDCRMNALGAFTEVALLPVALEHVHPSLIISQDTCSMYLGDDVPDHCWITESMSDTLTRNNRAAKTDGAVQRRTYRMHAGISPGITPLPFLQGIICDREITEICSFEIMKRVRIVFCPYSAESELHAIDPGDENSEMFSTYEKSLAKRIASHIIEKSVQDGKSYRNEFREDAHRMLGSSYDSAIYKSMRFLFDGESGPLTEVFEKYGEEHEADDMSWFKHATKHSKTIQPNDLAPGMHAGWKRAVRSDAFLKFSKKDVEQQVAMYPGMRLALEYLQKQQMSPASKHMFEKAIAYTPTLLSKHVTVSIVQKAFSDAKIYPLNEAEMFANMFSPFSKLSQLEALECLRIAQGPLRQIAQNRFPRGIIFASEVQRVVSESEIIKNIVNVSTSTNIDDHALNRQGAIYITKEIRELHVERQDTAMFQIALAQNDAQDKKKKQMEESARMKHCIRTHNFNQLLMTMSYDCRCGGTWTDGQKGFLAHEKLKVHKEYFKLQDWDTMYATALSDSSSVHNASAPLDHAAEISHDNPDASAAGALQHQTLHVPRAGGAARGRGAARAAPRASVALTK